MEIEISKLNTHEWESEIFPHDTGASYEELKADIKERGLKTPIHITTDKQIGSIKPHTIIAGHRRVAIMRELGHKTIPAIVLSDFASENEINQHFLYDNVLRRNLDKIQRVLVYLKLLEVESQKAKERLKLTGGKAVAGKAKLPYPTEAGQARDLAAKKLGLSGRTMEMEMQAYKWVKEEEESLQEWNNGVTTTAHIMEAITAEKKYVQQTKTQEPLPIVPYVPKEEEPEEKEEPKALQPNYEEIEEQDMPQVDLIKADLERTIEILKNREYSGKHKRQIQHLYELCKEALKAKRR